MSKKAKKEEKRGAAREDILGVWANLLKAASKAAEEMKFAVAEQQRVALLRQRELESLLSLPWNPQLAATPAPEKKGKRKVKKEGKEEKKYEEEEEEVARVRLRPSFRGVIRNVQPLLTKLKAANPAHYHKLQLEPLNWFRRQLLNEALLKPKLDHAFEHQDAAREIRKLFSKGHSPLERTAVPLSSQQWDAMVINKLLEAVQFHDVMIAVASRRSDHSYVRPILGESTSTWSPFPSEVADLVESFVEEAEEKEEMKAVVTEQLSLSIPTMVRFALEYVTLMGWISFGVRSSVPFPMENMGPILAFGPSDLASNDMVKSLWWEWLDRRNLSLIRHEFWEPQVLPHLHDIETRNLHHLLRYYVIDPESLTVVSERDLWIVISPEFHELKRVKPAGIEWVNNIDMWIAQRPAAPEEEEGEVKGLQEEPEARTRAVVIEFPAESGDPRYDLVPEWVALAVPFMRSQLQGRVGEEERKTQLKEFQPGAPGRKKLQMPYNVLPPKKIKFDITGVITMPRDDSKDRDMYQLWVDHVAGYLLQSAIHRVPLGESFLHPHDYAPRLFYRGAGGQTVLDFVHTPLHRGWLQSFAYSSTMETYSRRINFIRYLGLNYLADLLLLGFAALMMEYVSARNWDWNLTDFWTYAQEYEEEEAEPQEYTEDEEGEGEEEEEEEEEQEA